MDQFPNQPGQPAPFVFAQPGETEEGGFDFWGVLSRRKWVVFLGLICGMALGGLYHSQCDEVYRSEAKVRIEPKDPTLIFQTTYQQSILPNTKDLSIRHDQLIGQENIVNRCLTDNGLDQLRSFSEHS